MGLLRAVADVVIIGSGTLRVDCRHVWTAEAIFPALANEYRKLRETLGNNAAPLNVLSAAAGGLIKPACVRIRQGAGTGRYHYRRC